jgi:2-polyprenyl-6-methoxyphenol hydroxylase-like FAD-dependent oxidoreductase
MRIVVVGGGLVGPALARALAGRGVPALAVLERAPAGVRRADPMWLPFQAYDVMADVGVMDLVRREGVPIVPMADGTPTGYGIFRRVLMEALQEGVPMLHEHALEALVTDAVGRVTGLRAAGPDGPVEWETDLVVGCDGAFSSVRAMAGIPGEVGFADDGWIGFVGAPDPDRDFAMRYLSDGRQIGFYAVPGGSMVFWQIERIGRERALAPGVEAVAERVGLLLPEARTALTGLRTADQLVYWESPEVTGCDPWWVPGAVVIGDAAHALTAETGVGAGLGLGDALALAEAVRRHPGDPDAACRAYEAWRRPAVAPYQALRVAGLRTVPADAPSEPPAEERWPPA